MPKRKLPQIIKDMTNAYGKDNKQSPQSDIKNTKNKVFIRKYKANATLPKGFNSIKMAANANSSNIFIEKQDSPYVDKRLEADEYQNKTSHAEKISKCFSNIDSALVKYDKSVKQIQSKQDEEKCITLNNSEVPDTIISIGSSVKESFDIDKRPIDLKESVQCTQVTSSMLALKQNAEKNFVDKVNYIKIQYRVYKKKKANKKAK